MTKQWLIWSKIILVAMLIIALWGFWYFETSLILRITTIILGGSGLWLAFKRSSDKPPLASPQEFLILLILYIGLFSLYNLLYSLSIPLFIIMIAILVFVSGLFFGMLVIDRLNTLIGQPLFWVFILLIGLVILESFLSLSFWPIDPKIKSLIIVVIFYLVTNSIYLHTHHVLKLKRITGYLAAGFLIIGLSVLIVWLGLR